MPARSPSSAIALLLLLPGAFACAKDEPAPATAGATATAAAGTSAAAAITPAFPSDSAPFTAAPGSVQGSVPGPVAATPAPPASAAKLRDDLATISRYRLTMDKVNRYIAAQRGIGRKIAAMTPAQRETMRAEAARDDSNDDSLDDTVRKLEANAVVSGAIRDAGLSAREYATVMISLMQSSMAMSVLQARPNDDQDSLVRAMNVNPANIAFMKANQAEIARKSQELAEEMQRLGIER